MIPYLALSAYQIFIIRFLNPRNIQPFRVAVDRTSATINLAVSAYAPNTKRSRDRGNYTPFEKKRRRRRFLIPLKRKRTNFLIGCSCKQFLQVFQVSVLEKVLKVFTELPSKIFEILVRLAGKGCRQYTVCRGNRGGGFPCPVFALYIVFKPQR